MFCCWLPLRLNVINNHLQDKNRPIKKPKTQRDNNFRKEIKLSSSSQRSLIRIMNQYDETPIQMHRYRQSRQKNENFH